MYGFPEGGTALDWHRRTERQGDRSSMTIRATLTLAMPMKERAPVWSVMMPTRAERSMVLVIVNSYDLYWPSNVAA